MFGDNTANNANPQPFTGNQPLLDTPASNPTPATSAPAVPGMGDQPEVTTYGAPATETPAANGNGLALPSTNTENPAPTDDTSSPSSTDSPSTDSASSNPTDLPSPHPSVTVGGSDALLDIKQQALQQLTPLVDHLEQTPQEEFRTTMMMIQATDNQELVGKAFEAAKKIEDDKERAQAFLDIINEINYFVQHHGQGQQQQ